LETRGDIDAERIAFFRPSAGAMPIVHLAVENRYRAIVLHGTGLRKEDANIHPDANPVNFAPFIEPPTLVLHGVYDESTRLKTEAEPLFRLFGAKDKQLVRYPGGHYADPQYVADLAIAWLDEYLGPVRSADLSP
jgi:hypothetical protein